MMKEYIYYLVCPIDNVVRYVGKSKDPQKRYKQHIKNLDKLNTPKRQWLERLFSKGLKPICQVVEVCEGDARDREQYHVELNKETILNIHNPEKGCKSFLGRYPTKKQEKISR